MFDCLPLLNKLLAIRLIRRIKLCQSIFFFLILVFEHVSRKLIFLIYLDGSRVFVGSNRFNKFLVCIYF